MMWRHNLWVINPNPLSLGKELLPFFFFAADSLMLWEDPVTSCDVRAGGANSEGWSCMQCPRNKQQTGLLWKVGEWGRLLRNKIRTIIVINQISSLSKQHAVSTLCNQYEAVCEKYETCWLLYSESERSLDHVCCQLHFSLKGEREKETLSTGQAPKTILSWTYLHLHRILKKWKPVKKATSLF